MVFEPTFESIDEAADASPGLEGDPFADDGKDSDLAADGGKRDEQEDDLTEGAIEAGALASDVPYEELPPYGEQ